MQRGECRTCGRPVLEEVRVQRGFRILSEGREIPFDIHTQLCAHCGVVQTDPQPDARELARFYASQERDAFVAPDAADGATGAGARVPGEGSRRDQARWLARALGNLRGKRVLEVGCYEGYLLHLLAKRGAIAVGIEPSERAAALGRERYGVDVRTGLFEDVDLGDSRFDLVVLSHVLEHLTDPRAALEHARALCAPGGALFVEVPNVLAPRIESAVDFFTFDHLFNFAPATLGALARACGFEPVSVDDDFPFPAFRLLAAACEPARAALDAPSPAVPEVRASVRRYARERDAFVARLRARIDGELAGWRARHCRIAIYGAGYHTECLLDTTDLRSADVVALVDGNPRKQGTRVFGLPVVSPRELVALRPDAVVISSYDFQDEMVETLRGVGLGDVPTVTFYDRVQAFSQAG